MVCIMEQVNSIANNINFKDNMKMDTEKKVF